MNAPPLVGIREQILHRNKSSSSSSSSSRNNHNGRGDNNISKDRNLSSKSKAKSWTNGHLDPGDDDFSQPGVVTFYKPGNYSRNIQEAPDKDRWHIPATDQAKWICLRLRP